MYRNYFVKLVDLFFRIMGEMRSKFIHAKHSGLSERIEDFDMSNVKSRDFKVSPFAHQEYERVLLYDFREASVSLFAPMTEKLTNLQYFFI